MSTWRTWRNPTPGRWGWSDAAPSASRRAFLGGLGAAITLPFLPSLLPRGARAEASAAGPVRVLWWYSPNGHYPSAFHPAGVGALGTLPRVLEPLERHAHRMTVVSGLQNLVAEVAIPGDHVRGLAGSLTCRPITRTTGGVLQNGTSVDQVLAQARAGLTPYASLELGTTEILSSDQCDSGYACAYRNISWSSPTTPAARMSQPSTVFERLYGGLLEGGDPAERAQRLARRQSVLDGALDEVAAVQSYLSRSDRARLDEYLTGLRAIEERLAGSAEDPTCDLPGVPPRGLVVYRDAIPLLHDLLANAFACDLTRVASLMLELGGNEEFVPFLGFQEGSHQMSHHGSDPVKIEKYITVSQWRMGLLAGLLDRLEAIPEGSGSVLDNTLVVLFSEVNDGHTHTHRDLPIALFGGAGGAHVGGRHLRFDDTPLANLHASVLSLAGVPTPTFGADGTGTLAGLFS